MTLSLIPGHQPTDRPGDVGRRQATARDAGLAVTTQQAPPAAPQPQPPSQPRQRAPQQGFDALASREPTGFGRLRTPNTESEIVASFAASESPALRDIARRIRGF